MILSVALHGVLIGALAAKSNFVPVYHPAIYGVGGGSAVVRFVSVAVDGSGEGAGASSVPGDGSTSALPLPVEASEDLPEEKAPTVESLSVQAVANGEARPSDDSATERPQIESTPAVAAISEQSSSGGVDGESVGGNSGGQGNRRSQDGAGLGRSRGGGSDNSSGFGKPAYLRNPLPSYPRVARKHGWEGTTLLQVEVLDDGCGGKIEILNSSGHQVLDETAVETVRRWKFLPARSGTVPVRSIVEIPIRFRMAGN
jgi:TonB family protein